MGMHVQYVCDMASKAAECLQREGRGKKAGSLASNYTRLMGGSVYGSGQGRTGNMRPGVLARATWCRCTVDRLHQGKHTDEIKADTHLAKLFYTPLFVTKKATGKD